MESTFSVPTHRIETYAGKYPREDLEKVRAQLIKEIYDKETYEKRYYLYDIPNDINIKRKCGLLSEEVINYFRNNIKPAKRSLNLDDEIYPEDRNDFATQSQSTPSPLPPPPPPHVLIQQQQQQIFKPVPPPLPNLLIQQPQQQQQQQPNTSSSSLIDTKQPIRIVVDSTSQLCRNLRLSHGCELDNFKFCPKDIKPADNTANTLTMSVVYVCDNCQITVINKDNMLQHLNERNHLSASEYYAEKTVTNNLLTNTSIKYLKNRSILMSSNSFNKINNNNNELAVFCPKCEFPFSKNLVACSIHYSYVHTPGEFIYSLSQRTRTEIVYVSKSHSCFECKQKFKKLLDLSKHLDSSKHFPKNANTEISVLNCQLDKCTFKTTDFFPFKQHLLGHKFLQEQTDSDIHVPVHIYYYSKPTSFYHATSFTDSNKNTIEENKEEIKWIDSLVELYKGHNDSQDICKKLKNRKDHLHKILKANDTN